MANGKKGILTEFQEFISRGNVMDLAVGVIIGGAFTAIVNSLVTNVISPLISFITGGSTEVPGMAVSLGGNTIDFGAFLGAVINFLITAAAVFAIVKSLNALNEMKDKAAHKVGLVKDEAKEEPPAPRLCPYCRQEIPEDATRCPYCTSKLDGYKNDQDTRHLC